VKFAKFNVFGVDRALGVAWWLLASSETRVGSLGLKPPQDVSGRFWVVQCGEVMCRFGLMNAGSGLEKGAEVWAWFAFT